jgi:hypothetical protein
VSDIRHDGVRALRERERFPMTWMVSIYGAVAG